MGGKRNMHMTKQMSWVGMSLFLLLFSRAGWSLVPAEQGSSSQQQSAELQPKETHPQETRPTKPGPADDASRSESASSSLGQSKAPVGQTPETKDAQQPPQPRQQDGAQKPTGTAAAESEKATGVAASKPTGMAIAPAKQHRRRAFWVKVGAFAGAGLAAGTVFALSHSTASKPPGSH
jgi:hypothetical protein